MRGCQPDLRTKAAPVGSGTCVVERQSAESTRTPRRGRYLEVYQVGGDQLRAIEQLVEHERHEMPRLSGGLRIPSGDVDLQRESQRGVSKDGGHRRHGWHPRRCTRQAPPSRRSSRRAAQPFVPCSSLGYTQRGTRCVPTRFTIRAQALAHDAPSFCIAQRHRVRILQSQTTCSPDTHTRVLKSRAACGPGVRRDQAISPARTPWRRTHSRAFFAGVLLGPQHPMLRVCLSRVCRSSPRNTRRERRQTGHTRVVQLEPNAPLCVARGHSGESRPG